MAKTHNAEQRTQTKAGKMNPSATEWRPTDASDSPQAPLSCPFQHFNSLNDDLVTSVFSFVADVPFEIDESSFRSNLTHTLPYVSKKVRFLMSTGTDEIWRAGLIRMMEKEPYIWSEGVQRVVERSIMTQESGGSSTNTSAGNNGEPRIVGTTFRTREGDRVFVRGEVLSEGIGNEDGDEGEGYGDNNVDDDSDADGGSDNGDVTMEDQNEEDAAASPPTASSSSEKERASSVKSLVKKACKSLADAGMGGTCKRLFQEVVASYVRFKGPIFYMPGNVRLGEEFGLHFFEERYRLLIREVMDPFPEHFRRGDPIHLDGTEVKEFPKFIYANSAPLQPGAPAVIVEVRQCQINPNGTADVFLCPTSYIWIESIRERPNSGSLWDGRGVRMTRPSSRALERQAIEAEARRMAENVHMFPTGAGDHAEIMQALLDHLSGHGGEIFGYDDDEDDEEDQDNILVVD